MNGQAWDGPDMLAALRHGAAVLHSQVDEVNALNVFPVPDGDTGSNMLATVQAAISEAESVPERERSVSRIGAALSLGALMGARGNSGVILSQIFRGLGDAVSGVDRVGGRELAAALGQGCDAAFAAVAQPVDGTILTVVRDASRAASAAANDSATLEGVLSAAVIEATAAVARTPSQLAVLRRAGVVDAGGKGLELLLAGVLASTRGEHLPTVSRLPHDIALPLIDEVEAAGYGYETVFVVMPNGSGRLEVDAIRARLAELGESVLVAGDERAVKIHIHNERPDEVIAYGLSLGKLSRIGIENLDRQASDVRDRIHAAEHHSPELHFAEFHAADQAVESIAHDGLAVVAVASGEGMRRVFATLGASAVVSGGQGTNPSAGELADAIRATGAGEVIVLPNNPNVRMAAKQAAELCPHVKVEIVATRNAAEGVAAMLTADSELEVSDAAKVMAAAAARVQSLQVTVAVRNARMGRRRVRHGEFIVLGPTDGLVAADTDRTTAILAAVAKLEPGYELITLYRGRDVDHSDAEQLRDALRTRLENVEIELVEGDQPHYDFLISAE